MNKLISLLKIEVLNLYGINRLFQFKDKQKRKNSLIFMACAIGLGLLFIYISGTYSFSIIMGLQLLGQEYIFPSILLIGTVLFLLISTILKVQGILFGYKDYDMLISLPISTKIIVLSKIGVLYFMNLVAALLILIPGSVVYGVVTKKGNMYYLCTVISVIFVPVVPIVIASILGAMISYISTFFRKMRTMQYILTGMLILGFFSLRYIGNDNMNIENLESVIDRIYPLSFSYRQGVNYGELSYVLVFVGVSILLMLIFAIILSLQYTKINTLLSGVRTKSNYKMGNLQESTVQGAILKRELKRYFASPLYVFNTLSTPIMYLLFAIVITFFENQLIEIIEEMQAMEVIKVFIPFIGAFFASVACTTSCSISLEGKNLWISKVLPVDSSTIFKGKIGVNLIISIPIIFLGNIFLATKFKQNPYEVFLTMLMTFAYALFISYLGLVCNLKWARFDWKTESQVIKRGLATTVSVLIGMLISILSWFGASKMDISFINIMSLIISIVVLCICFIMNHWLKRKGSIIWNTL
jgi:hypothetical protein